MFDRVKFKEQGKANFKSNYWNSVLCALIFVIATGAAARFSTNSVQEDGGSGGSTINIPQEAITPALVIGLLTVFIILFLLKIFLFNPLEIGCCAFFKENVYGRPGAGIIKEGFQNYGHVFVTLLLKDVFLILWTLLFIVPGIMKAYSYRMVPFILRDEPDLSATEVIERSKNMMYGHRWEVFVFDLSYIGWYLLGGITLGIVDVFWTEPYRQNANGGIYVWLLEQEGGSGASQAAYAPADDTPAADVTVQN